MVATTTARRMGICGGDFDRLSLTKGIEYLSVLAPESVEYNSQAGRVVARNTWEHTPTLPCSPACARARAHTHVTLPAAAFSLVIPSSSLFPGCFEGLSPFSALSASAPATRSFLF